MTGYGAIPDSNADEAFKEYDVDYVQERRLTTKEKINKFLTAGVPILIAILVIVGFGWWTTQAVAPKQSDVGRPDNERAAPMLPPMAAPALVDTPPSTPEPSKKPKEEKAGNDQKTSALSAKGGNGPSCSDNAKCYKLGLSGACCPTNNGDFLDCCH